MKQWLIGRWEQFSRVLAALTKEEEIAQLCAQELAAWRARPHMKQESSLRVPMTDMRKQIRTLPLTEENSWLNPRTKKREHLALNYLNFSEAEWAAMDAPSAEKLQQRMEQQKLLNQPELIVRKATALLESKRWEEVVVGLAVLTGRRLSEVLKVGHLLPKTCYTAIFSGQLKRKDQVLDPYEIPTLIEAEAVIEAWDRLRTLLDCSLVETRMVSVKYGPAVKAAAVKHFSGIVPVREGKKEEVYTHLFRTVYGRIAVYYYCPPRVVDLTYLATIQGHYWVLDAKTEQQQRDYAATLHYYDYKIGDGAGQIDGRQGIRLGERDVQVLEVFQEREGQQPTAEGEQEEQSALSLTAANKTGYSMVRPMQQTRVLFDQVAEELGTRHQDETLQALIKEHYLLRQLQEQMRQTQEAQSAEEEPQDRGRAGESVQAELQALWDGLALEGVSDPLEYLRALLQKDANFREGLAKRYAGIDYAQLPFAQLSHLKTPEATIERLRRATKAVMEHNATTPEPLKRWYLNQSALHLLVGGRKSAIAEYLEAHKEEIEAHHQLYGITAVYNRKPVPITEMIRLAEEVPVEA